MAINPSINNEAAGEVEAAANRLGLKVHRIEIRWAQDIAPAFEGLRDRADAIYVGTDALAATNRIRINILALGARLPRMHGSKDYVEAGGLISYGPNFPDLFWRAAEYVHKILRGIKPGDIPVAQPTKFDLIVNLTAAKALGLTLPPTTGNTILGPDVAGKRLQILKEAIPFLSRVAFFWNPDNASHPAQLAELQAAAPTLGITLLPVAVHRSDEFVDAFTAMMRQRPDGFLMTNDPLHLVSIGKIIDFLTDNRLPGMFSRREVVMAGGLLSYGASLTDLFRRALGTRKKFYRVPSRRTFQLNSQSNSI